MALIARHTRFENTLRMPRLQRPGRRVFSLAVGLASMLVMVDAIFHPGSIAGLWTVEKIQDLSAVAELVIGSAAALGLAAAGYGLRSRRQQTRPSEVVAVMPTPMRPSRPRLHLVDASEFSSRAA